MPRWVGWRLTPQSLGGAGSRPARELHDPVRLPGRAAVEGEALLPVGALRRDLRPVEAHADRHALEHVVALEAPAVGCGEPAFDRRGPPPPPRPLGPPHTPPAPPPPG